MSSANRRTQENKILWLLQSAWPSWTPSRELSKISLQYGRAINTLRHKGWRIENRTRRVGGAKHGEFRLGAPSVPSSRELRKLQAKPQAVETLETPDTLFEISPGSRYPD